MYSILNSIQEKIDDLDFRYVEFILQEMRDITCHDQPTMSDLLSRIDDLFSSRSLALQRTLSHHDCIIRHSDRERGAHISRRTLGRINEFYISMMRMWPKVRYLHSMHITDVDAFERKLTVNGERAYLDIVGMRIVPRNYKDFFEILHFFEEHANTRRCMVNTFLFKNDDFKRYIGSSSSMSYRAVHYLLEIDGMYVELQVRAIGVDTWAKIHHVTMYKPMVFVTSEERKCISKFGEIASYVDCFNLARC